MRVVGLASVALVPLTGLLWATACELATDTSHLKFNDQQATGSAGASDRTGGAPGVGGGDGGNVGSGGSGGCQPQPEDCLNGLDDDCDEQVDCADTDCGDHSCQELPTGGIFVEPIESDGACDDALVLTTYANCQECECDLVDPGDCSHQALLYDNNDCEGTPKADVDVPLLDEDCVDVTVEAEGGDTVGAEAIPFPLNNAECAPPDASIDVSEHRLCALTGAGACPNGDICVPDSVATCVLFDGDVACSEDFGSRRLLYDTSATTCDCACDGGQQSCPTEGHYHAKEEAMCDGAKHDVDGDGDCHDTGLSEVLGVSNHADENNALNAKCVNKSAPAGVAVAKTLCCQ